MRRVGVLFLFMLILVLTAAPIEVTAADGDLSGDSVTSFSETTDDDRMLYPDCDEADTDDYTLAGSVFDGSMLTHSVPMDSTDWVVWNTASGTATTDGEYVQINDTSVGANAQLMIADDEAGDLQYGWLMLDVHNLTGTWKVTYFGGTLRAYSSDTGVVRIELTVATPEYYIELNNRYEAITFDWMLLTDTYFFEAEGWAGYCDSFASAADWTTSDTSISTDGDLATITENGAGSTGRAYASFSSTDFFEYYYEFRIESMTATTANLEFWDGAAYNTLKTFTAAGTYNGIISDADAATMQRIGFLVGSEGGNVKPDYLRVGPADEMGFCHDGSTTAGVSDNGQADSTFIYSSDGDILTLNVTRDVGAATAYCYFYIALDTTATSSGVELDYYPFFAVRYKITSDSTTNGIRLETDLMFAGSAITKDVWTTTRTNMVYMGYSEEKRVWFYAHLRAEETAQFEVDWCKAYSIANNTVTRSGAGMDDYLYVDSGILYSSIDDGYIELNHDPALSVSDTYPVYNLTTPSTAPEFSQYVSAWSSYSDDTRGATTSGTVTDIKLKFNNTETLSAIKFIEDSTAPVVVRSSSTPNDPEDDESTTLSAVITDTVEVYSVAFNAIVYPTGFSDVDYSANEQADNLWNYTFSSLDAGYYCFKIIASDGANTNALTEYAYIELSVREAAIRVEEITLIGAGSDFEMMTFSARINRDCSFTIYEESASSPESDTHTGSVTAPSFNLAWTKLDVDDANVNFTIRFTSGSLTYNYTSQYQVAQTTFYVSTVTQMVSLDTVTVTGRITKLGAYQVYDGSDVLKDYGSITDLDFKIQFTRWGGYDEQNHDFAIKFTNGTQTCWYNSSFYAFKKPVVAPFPIEDKNALYAFQASFWTAVMIFFVMLMIGIDFYRRNK